MSVENNILTIELNEKTPSRTVVNYLKLIFLDVSIAKNKIIVNIKSNNNETLKNILKCDIENIIKYEKVKTEFEDTLNNIDANTPVEYIEDIEKKIGILEILKYRVADVQSKKHWLDRAEDNAIKIKHKLNSTPKDSPDRRDMIKAQNHAIGDKEYSLRYYNFYLKATEFLYFVGILEKLDENYGVIRNAKISAILIDNIKEDENKLKKIISDLKRDGSSIILGNDEMMSEIKKIKEEQFNLNKIHQQGFGKQMNQFRAEGSALGSKRKNRPMPKKKKPNSVNDIMEKIVKEEEEK